MKVVRQGDTSSPVVSAAAAAILNNVRQEINFKIDQLASAYNFVSSVFNISIFTLRMVRPVVHIEKLTDISCCS